MKKNFGMILAGICCAVLIFSFLILPRLDETRASGGGDLQYHEGTKSGCFTPCESYVSCGGSCGDNQDCCAGGSGTGGACLYCDEVTVK